VSESEWSGARPHPTLMGEREREREREWSCDAAAGDTPWVGDPAARVDTTRPARPDTSPREGDPRPRDVLVLLVLLGSARRRGVWRDAPEAPLQTAAHPAAWLVSVQRMRPQMMAATSASLERDLEMYSLVALVSLSSASGSVQSRSCLPPPNTTLVRSNGPLNRESVLPSR
jgi:hypothetical protein